MAKPGLRTHPKFRRLVHLLGMPAPHVLGHLELLWHVSWDRGTPTLGDALDVELAAEWAGEPGALVRALVDCRFLDRDGDAYTIHDWLEHAPEYTKKRAARMQAAKGRQQEETRRRYPSLTDSQTADNGRHMADSVGQTAPDGGQRPPMSGFTDTDTDPYKGEESPLTPSCPETEQTPSSGPSATPPPQKVLLAFPCDGAIPEWHLVPGKLAEWQQAFPSLDVLAECRRALQWIKDNPERRKTAKGMSRFLGSWLGRAQDRGRGGKPSGPNKSRLDRLREDLGE